MRIIHTPGVNGIRIFIIYIVLLSEALHGIRNICIYGVLMACHPVIRDMAQR